MAVIDRTGAQLILFPPFSFSSGNALTHMRLVKTYTKELDFVLIYTKNGTVYGTSLNRSCILLKLTNLVIEHLATAVGDFIFLWTFVVHSKSSVTLRINLMFE